MTQKDSRLWLKTAAFSEVARRILPPLALVSSGLQLVVALLLLFTKLELDSITAVGPEAEEEISWSILFIGAFYHTLHVVLFVGAVASFRRFSEFNADLAAIAVCGPSGLTRLLEKAAERKVSVDFFGTHLSAKSRLAAIREQQGMTVPSWLREAVTVIIPLLVAGWFCLRVVSDQVWLAIVCWAVCISLALGALYLRMGVVTLQRQLFSLARGLNFIAVDSGL